MNQETTRTVTCSRFVSCRSSGAALVWCGDASAGHRPALLTDLHHQASGTKLIAVFSMLGLRSLPQVPFWICT
jgi:hypothetical protein